MTVLQFTILNLLGFRTPMTSLDVRNEMTAAGITFVPRQTMIRVALHGLKDLGQISMDDDGVNTVRWTRR